MNAYLTAPAVTLQYALTRSLGFPPTKGLLLWTYIEESCEDVEIELRKGNEHVTRSSKHNYTDAYDMEYGFIDYKSKLEIKVAGKVVKKYTVSAGAISGALWTDVPPAHTNPIIEIGEYYASLGIFQAPSGMKHELYVHIAR